MSPGMPDAIAICGSGDGCGKTTTGEIFKRLLPYPAWKIALAEPLKKMADALYAMSRNKTEGVVPSEYKRNNAPLEEFGGHSYREILRTLGTDWGRETFGDSFWTDILIHRVRSMKMTQDSVMIVDDLRFKSEIKSLMSEFRVLVLYVDRTTATSKGPKEDVERSDADVVIDNNGTIKELKEQIKRIVRTYWNE